MKQQTAKLLKGLSTILVIFAVIISAAVYATIQHERLDLFRE